MGFRGKTGLTRWIVVALACAAIAVSGCHNNTASNLPAITTQPANQTVTVGQTATFTVAASGTGTLMYQWYLNAVAVQGATSTSYTTQTTTLAMNGDFVFVLVSNEFGSTESVEVGLTVTGKTGSATGSIARVGTLRNDPLRTGQSISEPILAPGNVNAASFGKTGFFATDGAVDAQPLFVGGVNAANTGVSTGAHNVVYVATEANSVYAFDEATGAALWRANLNGAGETPGDSLACGTAGPEIGISSTPVIDPARGPNGAIYVVAMTKNASGGYAQRVHALDLATGAEMAGSPAELRAGTALRTVGGTTNSFEASRIAARGGLLLAEGRVYASLAPICGSSSSASTSGWIVGFDGASLAQTGALRIAGSDAITADIAGNVFANGATAIAPAAGGSRVNSLMRLSASNGLSIADVSAATGVAANNLQSGAESIGMMLLPDQVDASGHVWHLAVTTDASGDLFVVNRDSSNASTASVALQQIAGAFVANGTTADTAYFNGRIYVAAAGNHVKAFAVNDARVAPVATNQSVDAIGGSLASVSISAAGSANGIVWVIEQGQSGTLRAFDATNLAHELYDSAQAANNRDAIGAASVGVPATIANGKAYVATPTGVVVFGPAK